MPIRRDSISHTWGTTPEERARAFPCDTFFPDADAELFRGVTVDAPAARAFRWLCQFRLAPYSYDWIDNGGRRSPRELTPGLEHLALGQDVMRIFTLVDFEKDRHLTLRIKPQSQRTFGDVGVTYLLVPLEPERCRLLVKLLVRFPRGFAGMIMRTVLPWGDLIMMRRQLLNLKALAEGKA